MESIESLVGCEVARFCEYMEADSERDFIPRGVTFIRKYCQTVSAIGEEQRISDAR